MVSCHQKRGKSIDRYVGGWRIEGTAANMWREVRGAKSSGLGGEGCRRERVRYR